MTDGGITVVDLFAGTGGLSTGVAKACEDLDFEAGVDVGLPWEGQGFGRSADRAFAETSRENGHEELETTNTTHDAMTLILGTEDLNPGRMTDIGFRISTTTPSRLTNEHRPAGR